MHCVFACWGGWTLVGVTDPSRWALTANLWQENSPEVVFIFSRCWLPGKCWYRSKLLGMRGCLVRLVVNFTLSPTAHPVPALSPSTTRLSRRWWVWLADTVTIHRSLTCFSFLHNAISQICRAKDQITVRSKEGSELPVFKVYSSLFRTWWRVTWCTPFARRWRCWKNTSRSCTRGTLSWNGRTPCWSLWLILSSLASFPANSFIAAAAAPRCSSSSRCPPLSSPPYHSPRAARLSATSPTSRQRDSPLHRTCANTRSAPERLWDVPLAMQLPALPSSPLDPRPPEETWTTRLAWADVDAGVAPARRVCHPSMSSPVLQEGWNGGGRAAGEGPPDTQQTVTAPGARERWRGFKTTTSSSSSSFSSSRSGGAAAPAWEGRSERLGFVICCNSSWRCFLRATVQQSP